MWVAFSRTQLAQVVQVTAEGAATLHPPWTQAPPRTLLSRPERPAQAAFGVAQRRCCRTWGVSCPLSTQSRRVGPSRGQAPSCKPSRSLTRNITLQQENPPTSFSWTLAASYDRESDNESYGSRTHLPFLLNDLIYDWSHEYLIPIGGNAFSVSYFTRYTVIYSAYSSS